MYKENDNKKGIVRVYWQDIRDRVARVTPSIASIIDELKPGKDLPLYLAYYPYGTVIADTHSFYLPKEEGAEGFQITDEGVMEDLVKDLGYAKNSLPMGILLEKDIEYTIDLKGEENAMPWLIYSPGSFFPFSRVLTRKNPHVYAPNGILTLVSGIKSAFMLPSIGDAELHGALQRNFNIQSAAPKTLYGHSEVFKEIANSPAAKCEWRSCILFFSEKWVEKLYDEAWMKLKLHLHELAWNFYEYQRNRIFYDMYSSLIQKRRSLKPNPYLVDVARHLYATAIGAAPGYIPATNENGLPLNLLQEAYVEYYRLEQYYPTIMHAAHFNFEKDKLPIYYSMKYPSTYIFSPKARKVFSALVEMRELEHIMKIFAQEWKKPNDICSDTIMHACAKVIEFDYFHNEEDSHHIIKMTTEISKLDPRFTNISLKNKLKGAKFASDAPFVRGCVSIKVKDHAIQN